MTTPEDRVKQVLSSEADQLVPPPDLARTAIRRGRRVRRLRVVSGVAVIAAAVVAAIVVPTASLSRSEEPQPAGVISDGGLVTVNNLWLQEPDTSREEATRWLDQLRTGEAPKVPTVQSGSLVDGSRSVRFPLVKPQSAHSFGRVDGGWVVALQDRFDEQGPITYGELTPTGTLQSLATGHGLGATLSPDRTQLAYAVRDRTGKLEVIVREVATRMIRAKVTVPDKRADLDLIAGWNLSGIWLNGSTGALLWAPGSALVPVPAADVRVVAPQSSLVQTHEDPQCARLASWDKRLVPRIQYCGFAGSLAVSPDAKTVVVGQIAFGLYEPRTQRLDLPTGLSIRSVAWEDETRILFAVQRADDGVTVVRCDTTTGSCERAPAGPDVTLPRN